MPLLLPPAPFYTRSYHRTGHKPLPLVRERYATHAIQPIYERQDGRGTTLEDDSEAQKGRRTRSRAEGGASTDKGGLYPVG